MNRPRHQLFAGAALARDQHRRLGGRHLPDHRKHLLHRRARAHQIHQNARISQAAGTAVPSLPPAGSAWPPAPAAPSTRSAGWASPETRTRPDRAWSEWRFRCCRMRSARSTAVRCPALPSRFNSSKPSMRGIIRSVTRTFTGVIVELLERFLAVRRGLHRESPGLDHFRQTSSLILFVVRDEDASRRSRRNITHRFQLYSTQINDY